MGFLHQLHLLLWKNISLKRRGPVSPRRPTAGGRAEQGTGAAAWLKPPDGLQKHRRAKTVHGRGIRVHGSSMRANRLLGAAAGAGG